MIYLFEINDIHVISNEKLMKFPKQITDYTMANEPDTYMVDTRQIAWVRLYALDDDQLMTINNNENIKS